jgi:transcriptional regulator with XRE-family HTH domain
MPASARAEFGGRLRAWRLKRGMTQVELAAASRVSQVAISRYEAGAREPSLTILLALAEALKLRPDRLALEEP